MEKEIERQQPPVYYLGPAGGYNFRASARPARPSDWVLQATFSSKWEHREVRAEELVEFANCPDTVEAVQTYVSKFGPLTPLKEKKQRVVYAEPLRRWRSLRLDFCTTWDKVIGIEAKSVKKDSAELWKTPLLQKTVEGKGELRLTEGGPIFVADSHFEALAIKLLMIGNIDKLRKCPNPECAGTPYFIAGHRKAQYCSEECAEWGQRQAKLKYWRFTHRPGKRGEVRSEKSKKG